MSRLIDGDALHKRIKAKNTSNAMMRAMKAECLAEIDDAPTIEERKMGKWSVKAGKYICSVCRVGYGNAQLPYSFHYCPNCGAKMEEGE